MGSIIINRIANYIPSTVEADGTEIPARDAGYYLTNTNLPPPLNQIQIGPTLNDVKTLSLAMENGRGALMEWLTQKLNSDSMAAELFGATFQSPDKIIFNEQTFTFYAAGTEDEALDAASQVLLRICADVV